MALFHRPTQEALRRTALAGLTAAALAAVLAGCGGGGVGGSNTTHVEGYFLTPSGGLLQIPSHLVPNTASNPTNLAPVTNPAANAPYFLEMNSHAGDVSNGIQVSATTTTGIPALPSGEMLATDGGYLVTSSTSASINAGHVLSITLGFSDAGPTLTTAQITSLRVLEYLSATTTAPAGWVTLPNYYVNPTVTTNAAATGVTNYPTDTTLLTFPNTVTAQFSKFNAGGSTYFAVAYAPNNPTLDPFFGTYLIAFKPTLGAVPPMVDVDTGGNADANGNYALTANGKNATIPITGTINAAGTVSNFTIMENGVTYTLTGSFTVGNPGATPPTQTMGNGSYTGAGASGTWTATVQ